MLTARMQGVETVNRVKHSALHRHVNDSSCSVGLTLYQLRDPHSIQCDARMCESYVFTTYVRQVP
jgi:hypothetical protein